MLEQYLSVTRAGCKYRTSKKVLSQLFFGGIRRPLKVPNDSELSLNYQGSISDSFTVIQNNFRGVQFHKQIKFGHSEKATKI